MKKLISKIINFLNQPTDKIKPGIGSAFVVILMFLFKIINPRYSIIFMVIAIISMLIYLIMAILKHEDITIILIYLIGVSLGVSAFLIFYQIIDGVDNCGIEVFAIINFMLFFIVGYIRVKKLGNKDKIKQMKISLILAMPILFAALILFIDYTLKG